MVSNACARLCPNSNYLQIYPKMIRQPTFGVLVHEFGKRIYSKSPSHKGKMTKVGQEVFIVCWWSAKLNLNYMPITIFKKNVIIHERIGKSS